MTEQEKTFCDNLVHAVFAIKDYRTKVDLRPDLLNALTACIDDLPDPQHREVLLLRFRDGKTLARIAAALSLDCEEDVRRIEAAALRAMRHPARSNTFRDFVVKPEEDQ